MKLSINVVHGGTEDRVEFEVPDEELFGRLEDSDYLWMRYFLPPMTFLLQNLKK